jgi:hypothetical protein
VGNWVAGTDAAASTTASICGDRSGDTLSALSSGRSAPGLPLKLLRRFLLSDLARDTGGEGWTTSKVGAAITT